MDYRRWKCCCPSLLLALMCLSADAAELEGTTEAGAAWRIVTPDGWIAGDGLVLFNRGFRSSVPENPSIGPLLELQLEQGLAVAATGLSQGGWALFASADDNAELLEIFKAQVGEPGPVYAYGGSMGGLVTAQLAEDPRLQLNGALALCGVLGGTEVWDFALDLRLAYDVVCGHLLLADLPGGDEGYPFLLDDDWLDEDLDDLAAGSLGFAINACTGITLDERLRSDGQQRRLERLLALSGMDEDFFLVNMGYATLALSDLYHDPDKLDLGPAVDNSQVRYDDPEIEAEIERVTSDPLDRFYLRRHYTPTGAVGETRVIALNTDEDDLVWLENLGEYRQVMPADRLVAAVVDEDEPSHCGFSVGEAEAAWTSLLSWAGGGPQPTAADLQQSCVERVAAGVAEGPCRIESAAGVGDFDARRPPRNLPERPVDGGISGAWYDPARPGEGWLVEVLDAHRVIIYWFTYPIAGSLVAQRWLVGEGRITDFGVHVERFEDFTGGALGGDFNPEEIRRGTFGAVDFVFPACDGGALRVMPGSESAVDHDVVRLTALDGTACEPTPQQPTAATAWSGSWFDPDHPGEGWIVQALPDGRVLVVWFSYEDDGSPLWLIGTGEGNADGFTVTLDRPVGARFGADFDPDDVELQRFGALTFSRVDCSQAMIQYLLEDGRSGEVSVVRLTVPQGVAIGCGG